MLMPPEVGGACRPPLAARGLRRNKKPALPPHPGSGSGLMNQVTWALLFWARPAPRPPPPPCPRNWRPAHPRVRCSQQSEEERSSVEYIKSLDSLPFERPSLSRHLENGGSMLSRTTATATTDARSRHPAPSLRMSAACPSIGQGRAVPHSLKPTGDR